MAEQLQTNASNGEWTTIIRPRTGWFDIDLQELWRYRDLIVLFVKRNFAVLYKQTILGPAWVLLNPLLTSELGADSNLGSFAQRWEVISRTPGDDGAAFFVWGRRPPYDPAELPRTTRLERLVGERLADGRGWENGLGSLVR